MKPMTIKRALLSVSDKSFLEELARGLLGHGIELLATGGTAEKLKKAGIKYRPIEEFTGNPEAFDGRMKTISFKLESAILFDRHDQSHVEQALTLGIEPIDLVVCNFYPFEAAVDRGDKEDDLVHEIDVGGPTMVRAAAKNYHSVLVLTNPSDYQGALQELRSGNGAVSFEFRRQCMIKAFEKTMRYDRAVFEAFSRKKLRYGENPHQEAYFVPDTSDVNMDWELIEPSGLELSYNNILDSQAALAAVRDVKQIVPHGFGACAIVKHNNPCGLATATTIAEAFTRAWAGDPVSSFGGVVAFSSPLTVECARLFDQKFVEVVIAPAFEDGAIEELRRKKKKLRVLRIKSFEAPLEWHRTRVDGGTLVQYPDEGLKEDFSTVTKAKFPHELEGVGKFGVVAAKWIKSNAISIVRACADGGYQLVGMGSGQPNRVDAVRKLAIPKALEVLKACGENQGLSKCVLVSDAFFPFPDNIDEAAAAGVKFIVQPGGSIRDPEVIAAADKSGVAMAFTGKRHFRH